MSHAIQYPLQPLNICGRGTTEQRVAVVQSCADDAAWYSVRHSSIKHRSDVSQSTDVKVARFDYVADMLIEGELLRSRVAPKLLICTEYAIGESATLIPDPLANFAALDRRATRKTFDLSGFSSTPFLVNQSMTASVHSLSFLMLESDLTAK
jgi:hypothetical protein